MIEFGNFWAFVCFHSLDAFEWNKLSVHTHTDNYIFMLATPWTPHDCINWLKVLIINTLTYWTVMHVLDVTQIKILACVYKVFSD